MVLGSNRRFDEKKLKISYYKTMHKIENYIKLCASVNGAAKWLCTFCINMFFFLHIMWIHGGVLSRLPCSSNFNRKQRCHRKSTAPLPQFRISKNLTILWKKITCHEISFPYSEGFQAYLPPLVAFQVLWRQQTQSLHLRCWPCGNMFLQKSGGPEVENEYLPVN